jgi:hypothetical protein
MDSLVGFDPPKEFYLIVNSYGERNRENGEAQLTRISIETMRVQAKYKLPLTQSLCHRDCEKTTGTADGGSQSLDIRFLAQCHRKPVAQQKGQYRNQKPSFVSCHSPLTIQAKDEEYKIER